MNINKLTKKGKNHFQFSIFNFQLIFRQPAGTSRGTYTTRKTWYVILSSPEDQNKWGVGECAPLLDLSCDALADYEKILTDTCRKIEYTGILDIESLRPYPSILFGLETAFRHFETGSFALWDTPFSRGEKGIPINGLIWMGDVRKMLEQIEAKTEAGFRCIKLKIGAIRFEEEIALLRYIRQHFSSKDIELRVDANGAFHPEEALEKLKRLAEFEIHSIEQPIRAGQWEEMSRLADNSPIPIALDEELIGCNQPDRKRELLEAISPQYIILKPSLHGGITGCNEWIGEANRLGIGWWITSALESNIGLNAIAQWCAELPPGPLRGRDKESSIVYQGLGTGGLFTNNVEMPLSIKGDELWFTPQLTPHPPKGGALKGGSPPFRGVGGEWFDDSPYMTVQTSGSTGEPKLLSVEKKRMRHSAEMTCSFLKINKGDTALLCMPLQYIGSKMMVVRALTHQLNLIVREASGHPLKDMDSPVDFASMTPLQVYNSLQVAKEKERLKRIKILLIGGGAIDPLLERELQSFPNSIYSTYGMTETLSHIALRRLSGPEASPYYMPLPGVKVSLSEENSLIINAPLLCKDTLETNDIAEVFPDGSFRILGRKDNMINTGGIKILAETIEGKLRTVLNGAFAITSIPDAKFGKAIVLLSEESVTPAQLESLPKYERPRHILQVQKIPLTENGKIDRKVCEQLANSFFFRSNKSGI